MMKLRKNNQGFTLVELIVSTAILSIVALAASAFMVAGTRTYSSVNYSVRLQYEAQIAMAQLQEYIVDCTDGIAWEVKEVSDANGVVTEQKILYIVNGTDVHLFKLDSGTQTLSYGTAGAAVTMNPTYALAAEHITYMDVQFDVGKAEITLQMQRNNKTYSATQVIALRNQPKFAYSWADL